MADSVLKQRRMSSIPKLPDDDMDEVITTIPDNEKSLPPLPGSNKPIDISVTSDNSGQEGDTRSSISVSSSISTKSFINGNSQMKSMPVVSATTTNAVPLTDDSGLTKDEADAVNLHLHQIQKDNMKQEKMATETDKNETGRSGYNVGSFLQNVRNYGIYRSQSDQSTMEGETNAGDANEGLDDGIKFEKDKGTEMLSYRKSRGKNGPTNLSVNTETNSPISASNNGSATIIQHRKTRSISTPLTASSLQTDPLVSPASSITSPTVTGTTPVVFNKTNEVDYNLYVDEKYLDTQYRYATEKRNEDFHNLFSDVPADDRLLDDFSCALSKEILLQGRVYISEHYLCFNSSLLGWVTNLVISLDEIQKFERRSTVGLFPNGIILETREAKHIFASFISRDSTLNFIETVWSKSISLSKKNHEKSRDFESLRSKSSFEGVNNKGKMLSESDIYTIDDEEDDDDDNDSGDYYDRDDVNNVTSSDESSNNLDSLNEISGDTNKTEKKPKKSKSKSAKKYPGPYKHEPSTYVYDEKANNEKIVLDKEFEAPLGLVYDIFFGENIEFHKNMMIMNDGLNFTDYGGLAGEGCTRSFEYDKSLNFPIGPSSTRVFCTEEMLHFDLKDYVQVLNISKTPNVPSGTAFDCRTKYTLLWSKEGKTRIIISFKLEWTGSSWFKSVIESSALSGQQKAAGDVNTEMLKVLPAKIIEYDVHSEDESEGESSSVETDVVDAAVEKPKPTPIAPVINNPIFVEDFLVKQTIPTSIGTFKISNLYTAFSIVIIIQLLLIIYLLIITMNLSVEVKQQRNILSLLSEKIQSLDKSIV